MSRAIAIKNPAGRHIGFLLSASNHADSQSGDESGDCIFRSLPSNGDDFDDPLAKELFSLQEKGEFVFRMTINDAGRTYEVRDVGGDGYDVVIGANGQGYFYRIAKGGVRDVIGQAQLVESKTTNKS